MWYHSWFKYLAVLTGQRSARRRKSSARRRPERRFTLETLEGRLAPSASQDFLYVGDDVNNTVQRFDATSGEALGSFVDGNKSLDGPRGMVFDGHGHFLLANQNSNRGKSGEIMQYDAATGAFLGELVPFQDPNAPFAPRGMVLKDNVLYVASLQNNSTSHGVTPSGEIDEYDATTGAFLGRATPPASLSNALADQRFNPRGIVFGPDGNLYISSFDTVNPNAGYVLKLNETNHPGEWSVVAFNNGDSVADPGETADLHRPEGLVFGPDNNLYVTSFRSGVNDTDKIVVFNPGGVEVDNIALDAAGQPRAFGQALLFGPGGRLFVPITGNGADTGAVRSYDVTAKTFTNFIAPGSMGSPWYLTFGNTDPATLAYNADAGATMSLAMPHAEQPLASTETSSVPSSGSLATDAGSASGSDSSARPIATTTISLTSPPASASPTSSDDLSLSWWNESVFVDAMPDPLGGR